MFLFLGILLASQILKEIGPKDLLTFYEEINPQEDQFANLSIGLLSPASDVYYRIIPPTGKKNVIGGSEDSEDSENSLEKPDLEAFEKPLERGFSTKIEAPGVWTIQFYNKGSNPIRFSISSQVTKKVNKGNEDAAELRNLLGSIQSAVEALANENYYANNIQKINIKDAMNIKSTLTWLIIIPFAGFAIAWFKYVCARQLVRPKGKRFKGLF